MLQSLTSFKTETSTITKQIDDKLCIKEKQIKSPTKIVLLCMEETEWYICFQVMIWWELKNITVITKQVAGFGENPLLTLKKIFEGYKT